MLAASGTGKNLPMRALMFGKLFGFRAALPAVTAKAYEDAYDKRKLRIFNRLNTLGLITGIFLPLAGLFNNDHLPLIAWVVACSPAFIGGTVLIFNYFNRYTAGLMVYFTLYPLVSSLVYAANLDLGIELFFILYGALAVFFIPKMRHALICCLLSALSYFVVFVLKKNYPYELSDSNFPFYAFNQLLALSFIFYALYLIKKENTSYQQELIEAYQNLEQKKILVDKQTEQLSDLNSLKNKLFSVIAHDLRTPIYALKNLFKNMDTYDMPADEIKMMVPDIHKELQFTTSLMENLLQWAKSQLQAASSHPEALSLQVMTEQVIGQLNLQSKAKNIAVKNRVDAIGNVWADKEMTTMVLRNLVSNALKFTPLAGEVTIGNREHAGHLEVFVRDNGAGMSPEILEKLESNAFFTTNGTANESGTGLGLMLCKEYLARNGGWLTIRSAVGIGSEFSFTLPKPPSPLSPVGLHPTGERGE
jgi:two-component system, sensor histidine kinase and response regulator